MARPNKRDDELQQFLNSLGRLGYHSLAAQRRKDGVNESGARLPPDEAGAVELAKVLAEGFPNPDYEKQLVTEISLRILQMRPRIGEFPRSSGMHEPWPKFAQVPLSSISTGRYAALLEGSPEAFSNVLNIQFERTRDDLDDCEAAQIVTASGIPAGLVYYPNAPQRHERSDERAYIDARSGFRQHHGCDWGCERAHYLEGRGSLGPTGLEAAPDPKRTCRSSADDPKRTLTQEQVDGSAALMKPFPDPRLGVFCCGHVFRQERSVRLVLRSDGDWQFLCGDDDHADPERPHHVHVGALMARDPSLAVIADLPPEWQAEREGPESPWIRTQRSI